MKQEISVVISTYNRQKLLKKCLDSIKDFASEIIVVDNSSSDDSVTIAKEYTKNIFVRKNNLMLNVNKNFGFTKASKEWILYLDDDEEITPQLQKEIQGVLSQDTVHNGFLIPRKNIIFSKWIEHAGWYPDYQLRLFKKGKGRYPEVHVHELIAVEGKIGTLQSPLHHLNYETILSFIQKMCMIYAPNEAQVLLQNGYVFSFADVLRFPSKEFFSRYFAREGYKDGFHGLVLSLLMAFYHMTIFLYIWEKKDFKENTDSLFLLENELPEMRKEFLYWKHTAKLQQAKNPASKILLKIKRKLSI